MYVKLWDWLCHTAEHNCWTQPLSMISKCCMSMCVVWHRRSWGDSDVKDWCDDWSKISGYRFISYAECNILGIWRCFCISLVQSRYFPILGFPSTAVLSKCNYFYLAVVAKPLSISGRGKKKKSRALNRVFMRVPPTFPLLYLFTIILAVFL